MGNRNRTGKISNLNHNLISHPCQLSLATPPWVGVPRTEYHESWGVNRHTTRCTSLVRGLVVQDGVWMRAKETEIAP